jgi:hypothetical protein
MQAVRQVVFTDVLIVGRLDMDGQSFAPIGLHKIDLHASDWLLIKRLCISMKGLPEVQVLKNNRTTAAIGVILAFTGEICFISTKNQRCLRKIQKPAATLMKTNIRQFLAILSKSISCDSPFKEYLVSIHLSSKGTRDKHTCIFPFYPTFHAVS